MELEQLEKQAQARLSQGRLSDAVLLFTEICRLNPRQTQARFQLAMALIKLNRLDQAVQQLQQIVQQQPDHTDAWAMMADIHVKTGRATDAKDCGRRALAIDPEHAHALLVTGIASAELGELSEADEMLTRAIEKLPTDAHACIHLARVCMRRQKPQRAETFFVRAREINPQLRPACVGQGNSLLRQERYDDAERVFTETCQRFPGDVALINQIGNMYCAGTRLEGALKHYRMALRLQPNSAEIQNNIANILKAQGLLNEAGKGYQRVIDIKPGFWQAHSNRIFLLNYLPGISGQELLDAHRNWADRQTQELHRFATWDNPRQTDRPLRVGYVSPDFHHHPVSAFMMPILANHNPDRVVSVCFADNLRVDSTTGQLREMAAEWHTIKSLSDEQFIELVRMEQIDILVDLAGHTGNHRLRVFACKSAPVQINYLGYPATTGLDEMDYRLTDAWADPPGVDENHSSEELLRIPSGFLCYQPDKESPEVAPPPGDATGTVTFGSLNNLSKINDEVVSTWSTILNAMPNSQLLIKNLALSDPAVQERYMQQFESYGIGRDRIDLRSRVSSYAEHLATYHEIDIGLDTFPYNGTTTTCEALWMGVPVVTVTGQLHAGRVGHSLLSCVQLPELISEDREHYKQIALTLANDPNRLRHLRQSLRESVRQSPLCDGPAFTRKLETIYGEVWARWCEGDALGASASPCGAHTPGHLL